MTTTGTSNIQSLTRAEYSWSSTEHGDTWLLKLPSKQTKQMLFWGSGGGCWSKSLLFQKCLCYVFTCNRLGVTINTTGMSSPFLVVVYEFCYENEWDYKKRGGGVIGLLTHFWPAGNRALVDTLIPGHSSGWQQGWQHHFHTLYHFITLLMNDERSADGPGAGVGCREAHKMHIINKCK